MSERQPTPPDAPDLRALRERLEKLHATIREHFPWSEVYHDALVHLRNLLPELIAALARAEATEKLSKGLDDLCVAYRIGKQPSGKTLDTIRKMKAELAALLEKP